MMNTKKIFLINISLVWFLFSGIFTSGTAEDDPGKLSERKNKSSLPFAYTISSKQMNSNNISTWYSNNGSYNRDPSTGNSGFEWPKGSYKFARYTSGMWIGAIVGKDTLVCVATYDYEYRPGFIDNEGNPQGSSDPSYRVYVINKSDSSSEDYQNWPGNQGAYLNERGKPNLTGDQTMFYSYTDGYPDSHMNIAGSTAPLKAVILQTNWCFKQANSLLNDVIFTEYRIINRGNAPWTKCYITQWTDDDLGQATDDAEGCDSVLNLGYIYNIDNEDGVYGLNPPAVGFLLLNGGTSESTGDTAKYFSPPGSRNLIVKPNRKILQTSSISNLYKSSQTFGEPVTYQETYRCLEGKAISNVYWINPITGNITRYPFSGDPESGTGWLMHSGDDRRFIITSGPLTVNPNDTQTVVIAQLIAKGSSNLNSVSRLKGMAKSVKNLFDNNFDISVSSPLPLTSSYAPGNGKIYLSWNDSCERVSLQNKFSGGIYKFQGYNIYRIIPNKFSQSSSDTILIKSFDVIDGITDIYDSLYLKDYEGIVYGIVQRGSDNGRSRYIVLDKDTASGNSFLNGSEYKFAVSAYYYDSSGSIYTLPKVYESPRYKNIIRVIPQNLSSGTQTFYSAGDTVKTNQKDIGVLPIIADPLKLTNAFYTSTFGNYESVTVWTLTKTVNGVTSVIFQNQKNFYGQDSALIYDGLLLTHQFVRDSGIVRDLSTPAYYSGFEGDVYRKYQSSQSAWNYDPPDNLWLQGPDTTAVKTAKVITNRQFDSRSIGMSFPTIGTFRNSKSTVLANAKFFTNSPGLNPILKGGPLRKIEIVFGRSSKSYRFIPADANFSTTPCTGVVNIPFSVYAVDELDSSGGSPRQLNTGFLDKDSNGVWDPDTSALGNYHFTYIFASNYDSVSNAFYLSKNPGSNNPTSGFPSMDIMYAWLPRVKKSPSGVPLTFTNGDKLSVSPYRITRADFVPGYPIKYNWSVEGTTTGNTQIASAEVNNIKAFPNPYFASSELEYDSGGEKFIYFSHLPSVCTISIYTLNGSPVRIINRNNTDPENSLEKWDLQNSGGKYVASGMYIVFVDCKGAGTKTLKIAVFTAK
jgi:hypothetical protein